MEPTESENPEVANVGLMFARALTKGHFEAAFRMLAPSLRDDCQPEDLKALYEQMTSYWTAPADHVELSNVVGDWPGKEEGDAGWAFVSVDSLSGQGGACLEQVCVRVVELSGQKLIAQIEWGRP